MTAPDSRDSVERVVAEMRERSDTSDDCCYGTIGTRCVRDWADRLQALTRGPQQAGGEDAKDAARYRWIRACDSAGEQLVMTADGRELKMGHDLDAAIDAAIGGTGDA